MNHSYCVTNLTPDPGDRLARLTGVLADCCQAKESELFEQNGLSAAEGRLLLLLREAGPLSPTEAAERLGVARSRLTLLGQNLVGKALVRRANSATDRRMHVLSLTPEGEHVSALAAECRKQFHMRLLERYEPRERAALLRTLEQLNERIRDLRRDLRADSPSTSLINL